ncbi:PepSY-associated TM helix domain-containing protein [Woodsholea maritima]|uniref:PepSY-associated TM helix domain-containing protein n=1 Tax=Woodsholea maritima TaxID=240237 RepID=UPI000372EDC3|nr:PepSY domain-containing protein [Woodsholea maritima]
MASLSRSSLYYRIWRWHFIAGLMVVPFAVILAITGAIYLFKPQYEHWIEGRINAEAALPSGQGASAEAWLASALAAHPEARFTRLTLAQNDQDRTVEIELSTDEGVRILWVDIHTGIILKDIAKSERLMMIVKDIHGNLMAGKRGSYIVELMASWMIVLIITGVYLWWPRREQGEKASRFFAPSFKNLRPRALLKHLHGVVGAWIGAMILILLLSGLPWTQVWGAGYDRVEKLMGWDGPGQEWFVTLTSQAPTLPGEHDGHDGHEAHMAPKEDGLNLWQRGSDDEGEVSLTSAPTSGQIPALNLDQVIARVNAENLAAPVEIQPPRGENGVWTVRSMTQYRPDRVTIHFDRFTGDEVMRIAFTDYHPVKQTISYGIAFHEGALFGVPNQILGVLAALGVIALSVSGALMWWKRKPAKALGVPPMPRDKRLAAGVIIVILALALFLPLVALSLIVALMLEGIMRLFKMAPR